MHSIPPQMWSAFRTSKPAIAFPACGSHALRTSRVCQAQASPRGHVSRIRITPVLAFPSRASNAGLVLPALARSALGTATPAASTGSRECLCRRRLGRYRGLGNHFITSGLVCQNLEHAGHTSSMALPCQAWTAVRFETLAQLALLQATHSHIGGGHYSFSMPSGTDNSATEASLNKLFTTSWPLQLFVQLTAFWAHARNVLLQPIHVPGRNNDGADDPSRGRLARFSHRPESRVRFSPAGLALSGSGVHLANPRGCASRAPITHILAFPSQASDALHGWRCAFSTRPFSPWRGHTSCKHWLPRMRVPKTTWQG